MMTARFKLKACQGRFDRYYEIVKRNNGETIAILAQGNMNLLDFYKYGCKYLDNVEETYDENIAFLVTQNKACNIWSR